MVRVTRFDTFMLGSLSDLDMLECRLYELESVPDLVHVIVEADVTHGGNQPKPWHYAEHSQRFDAWSERIVYVQATDLPDDPDPWTREHAQREWTWAGLDRHGWNPDDIVLHGDIDEIPNALAAEWVKPHRRVVVLEQRFHPFAVDWQHPHPWRGTAITTLGKVNSFARLRDYRRRRDVMVFPDAGWHFSWVGANRSKKLQHVCHTEIIDPWTPLIEDCYQAGLHVDGTPLEPVELDDTWPEWIYHRRCPSSWFRPRTPKPRPEAPHVDIVAPFAKEPA